MFPFLNYLSERHIKDHAYTRIALAVKNIILDASCLPNMQFQHDYP